MRVIIYCRVSTKDQEEDGTSLDTQEQRCRAYAAENGWQVTAVYRETHSGAELWERPKLTELREMMRTGAVDVLLAYALDRLSRSRRTSPLSPMSASEPGHISPL
jgi:site-specific DNA recombinase